MLIDVNDKNYFKSLKSYDDKITFQHFLNNFSYINPSKRNKTNALGGISNLTLQVSNALNNVLPNGFPTVDNILSSEDVCDKVRSEWRLYQTEIIPEDAYLNEKEVSPIKTRLKVSYWQEAFGIAGITEVGNIDSAENNRGSMFICCQYLMHDHPKSFYYDQDDF